MACLAWLCKSRFHPRTVWAPNLLTWEWFLFPEEFNHETLRKAELSSESLQGSTAWLCFFLPPPPCSSGAGHTGDEVPCWEVIFLPVQVCPGTQFARWLPGI